MSQVVTRWVSTTPQSVWVEKDVEQASRGVIVEDAAVDALQVTGTQKQHWEGFGGCFNELGWVALSVLSNDERQKIIDDLFDPKNGCRFSLCRLPIGASDYGAEWYSHNENDGDYAMEKFSIERDYKYLIPYIKQAQALSPNLKLFASPWSPPTWMKHPRAYNFGTLNWTPENLKAYALYFVKFVQAYEAEGLPISQVHVQNEPNSDQKFPSCLWTGAKMRDFIRDYLGPAFEAHGLDCEIWAGTIEREGYNSWANTILSDAGARNYVRGVGYQWAGKAVVQRTHQGWPEIRLMQTENECGDGTNTWEYAGYIFDLIHHYLSNGVNAYVYWNMVLAPTGQSTWGWLQNSMITVDPETKIVTYNPEFYVMKHFSHFVEPGARRVELQGPWSANALAFRNPDGKTVVVVRNPFDETKTLSLKSGDATFDVNLEPESLNSFVL